MMTDPKRLLEENGDALESAMLRSVRGDGVTPESRQRIFAGLGIVGAAVTTSAGAASSIAAVKSGLFQWTAGAAMKWIAISSVALVPAGVLVARSYRSGATREPVPTVQPAGVSRNVAEPIQAPIVDTTVVEPAAPAAAAREPKRSPGVQARTLSDEVAALQIARTALAQRDPNAALAALDRYKSHYASGRLSPEATVLRIEALVQKGDRAEATQLADRFEAQNPKSPYAERIRSIVRGAGNSAR